MKLCFETADKSKSSVVEDSKKKTSLLKDNSWIKKDANEDKAVEWVNIEAKHIQTNTRGENTFFHGGGKSQLFFHWLFVLLITMFCHHGWQLHKLECMVKCWNVLKLPTLTFTDPYFLFLQPKFKLWKNCPEPV